MPTNLNALIRYKQIDLCLKNPYLKATINTMQEKCSDQLAEHRGVYKLVSERTIRDDIRTMRSDALGFNAPIIVKDGIYRYEDDNYSIFNTSIQEMDLLKKIINLLLEERENIKSPGLQDLLDDLSSITRTVMRNVVAKRRYPPTSLRYKTPMPGKQEPLFDVRKPLENKEEEGKLRKKKFESSKSNIKADYLWKPIFEVL